MNKGILYGIGSYTFWGFFPIYLKFLHAIPTLQVVGHRVFWSFLFLVLLVTLRREWPRLRSAIPGAKYCLFYAASALLLSFNWLIFVYGVNNDRVVEGSLGYFINPLITVVLGVLILKERLRRAQWAAVGLAAIGVIYLTFDYGRLPWYALGLALTFALYGLAKKKAALGSFYGLTLETGIVAIPTLIYLALVQTSGEASFINQGLRASLMLAMLGPFTSVPLLAFGAAARTIDLSLLGLLQYITPTLQFLSGVFLFQESFTRQNFIGFSVIWIALIILSTDGFILYKRTQIQIDTIRAA